MADAMQGIMALPQAPEQANTTPRADPMAGIDPAALAAFEEARATADPVQVGNDLLNEGEKADPATLKALRRGLKKANLPPQILDAIGQMVDAIMAEPENYLEMRAAFLAEGVPEELLPEQFDAEFFIALNLVLDQVNTGYPQEQAPEAGGIASMPMGAVEPGAPQPFAQGGIAGLKPLAAEMAKMGRRGDTMLAHITPAEARMLRRRGGSGTINPATGLPEFFLGGVIKSVGNAFKSVGKAVVSGVKTVVREVKTFVKSPVGKVVTAVALGFFLGPAAASVLGVTSVAGTAAVSGFIGGFGSSMLAGDGIGKSLKTGAIAGVGAGLTAGVTGGLDAFSAGSYTGPTTISGQFDSLVSGTKNLFGAATPPTGAEAFPVTSPDTITMAELPPISTANAGAMPYPSASSALSAPSIPNIPSSPVSSPVSTPATSGGITTPEAPTSFFDDVTTGAKNLFNKVVPSSPSDAELQKIGMNAYNAEKATGAADFVAQRAYDSAIKAASPSVLRKYAPLVGAGLGIMGLTGGFTAPESEPPSLTAQETGFDLYEQDPEQYRINLQDPVTTYAPMSYDNMYATPLVRNMPAGYTPQQGVQRFAEGGYAKDPDYPTNMNQYPPMDGPINGPGTGTSDSIPAMLSDGEFVFTAQAVRNAGNGSRREGAKRMYALMKQLEEAKNGN